MFVNQVEPFRSSLIKDDVFILDCGLEIYQWNGETSNKDEKFKGMQYTQQLKRERAGKPNIVVLESSDIGGEVLPEIYWLAIVRLSIQIFSIFDLFKLINYQCCLVWESSSLYRISRMGEVPGAMGKSLEKSKFSIFSNSKIFKKCLKINEKFMIF